MLALIFYAVKKGRDIVFLCLVQIQPVKSLTDNLQTFYCGYVFFFSIKRKEWPFILGIPLVSFSNNGENFQKEIGGKLETNVFTTTLNSNKQSSNQRTTSRLFLWYFWFIL